MSFSRIPHNMLKTAALAYAVLDAGKFNENFMYDNVVDVVFASSLVPGPQPPGEKSSLDSLVDDGESHHDEPQEVSNKGPSDIMDNLMDNRMDAMDNPQDHQPEALQEMFASLALEASVPLGSVPLSHDSHRVSQSKSGFGVLGPEPVDASLDALEEEKQPAREDQKLDDPDKEGYDEHMEQRERGWWKQPEKQPEQRENTLKTNLIQQVAVRNKRANTNQGQRPQTEAQTEAQREAQREERRRQEDRQKVQDAIIDGQRALEGLQTCFAEGRALYDDVVLRHDKNRRGQGNPEAAAAAVQSAYVELKRACAAASGASPALQRTASDLSSQMKAELADLPDQLKVAAERARPEIKQYCVDTVREVGRDCREVVVEMGREAAWGMAQAGAQAVGQWWQRRMAQLPDVNEEKAQPDVNEDVDKEDVDKEDVDKEDVDKEDVDKVDKEGDQGVLLPERDANGSGGNVQSREAQSEEQRSDMQRRIDALEAERQILILERDVARQQVERQVVRAGAGQVVRAAPRDVSPVQCAVAVALDNPKMFIAITFIAFLYMTLFLYIPEGSVVQGLRLTGSA